MALHRRCCSKGFRPDSYSTRCTLGTRQPCDQQAPHCLHLLSGVTTPGVCLPGGRKLHRLVGRKAHGWVTCSHLSGSSPGMTGAGRDQGPPWATDLANHLSNPMFKVCACGLGTKAPLSTGFSWPQKEPSVVTICSDHLRGHPPPSRVTDCLFITCLPQWVVSAQREKC